MIYRGGCHCGQIAFEVEGEIDRVNECNCSHCRPKGYLLWFVPREQFRLATPEANLSTYRFNTQRIAHHFCATCGVAPFAEGALNDKPMAAVNVRCLREVELADLEIRQLDGRSL